MQHLNLARFDLISIRLAVACLQTGSLSAAAREIPLALAAASRRLRELEDAVGDTLFDRNARGLTPTGAGRVFVKHGLALLQTMETMHAELADQRLGVARHLRLCAGTAAINQFLPALLADYARLQPQIRVELDEQVSESVVRALREGRADVGVFVAGPSTQGLQVAPFRQDELVLVMPRGHPLSTERHAIDFSACLGEDWISLTSGAAMLQTQQQAALASQRPLRLRMQVRSFDAVCHLVAAGLGVALLPKGALKHYGKSLPLRSRPLTDAWARRQLLVAVASQDEAALNLMRFLVKPSRNAKADLSKQQ